MSKEGGALLFTGYETEDIVLEYNYFELNSAYYNGGAILFENVMVRSQISIFQNEFKLSHADNGGAMVVRGWSWGDNTMDSKNFEIKRNHFENNLAFSSAGIIYFIKSTMHQSALLSEIIIIQENNFYQNYGGSGTIVKFGNIIIADDLKTKLQQKITSLNVFKENGGKTDKFNPVLFNCTEGEYYSKVKLACLSCKHGSYNYNITENFYSCLQCPKNTICEGGYDGLKILKNTWINKEMTQVFPCEKNPEACIGGSNYDEQCLQGYQGPLCQVCQEQYHRNGGIYCNKCSSNFNIICRLIITYIGFMCIYLFITLKMQEKLENDIKMKYVKFLYNYFGTYRTIATELIVVATIYLQIIYLIQAILYKLPNSLQDYISQLTSIIDGYTSTEMCILPQIVENNYLLSELIWKYIWSILVFSFVIFLAKVLKLGVMKDIPFSCYLNQFLVLAMPSFVEKTIKLVLCENVGEQSYVMEDYSIECQSDQYFYQNVIFGVSTLFLWIVIFPLVLFLSISQSTKKQKIKQQYHNQNSKSGVFVSSENEKTHNNIYIGLQGGIKFRLKYGWIFRQFKYKYWNVYRQIAMIFLILISYIFSKNQQIRISLFTLIIFLFLMISFKYKPFVNKFLNNIFQEILIILSLTLLFGSSYQLSYSRSYVWINFCVIFILNIYIAIKIGYFVVREYLQEFSMKYGERIKKNSCLKIFSFIILDKYMEKKKNSRLNWNKLRNYVKSTPVEILSKKFNYQNYPLYNKYKNSYSRYFKKECRFQKIREQDYEEQNAQKNKLEKNTNKSSRNYSQVTYRNHINHISEELFRGSNINS